MSFIEELNKNLVSEEYKEECKKAGRLFGKSKERKTEMDIDKITELEETIKNAQAQIEELKKEAEKSTFYPKKGDIVWSISPDGIVYSYEWGDYEYDKKLFHQGHIFLTQEDAIFERERRAVTKELELFKEPKDRPWDTNNNHYGIYYHFLYNKVLVDSACYGKGTDIYFATREDAEKAIKIVGEDRVKKYYLRVED